MDLPAQGPLTTREEQLKDPDLRKILDAFSTRSPEETSNWTTRGYLTSQGVLYRYSPDTDQEEAQLVIPKDKRLDLLKHTHDAPTAGHYGAERTLQRVQRSYYWPGMRRDIYEYVKKCGACQRYKATNLKPPGLLQTPVMQQRFEVIAIDLFGPLPTGPQGERWIFIIEDTASRWVELLPLRQATAEDCGWNLIHHVFFRYGLPRRILSDNGTQFISSLVQYITHCFQIDQSFTPVYHPAANPVERKNRDLKTQLSIQLGTNHTHWVDKLPAIRFAMNTAWNQGTGYTAAYLTFGRELRTPYDVTHDLRQVIQADAVNSDLASRLTEVTEAFHNARETHEREQDRRKAQHDRHTRPSPAYAPGDLVWVQTHPISRATDGYTSKFAPKRDGPYVILTPRGPSSYEVASREQPSTPLGTYHASALRPATIDDASATTVSTPVQPLRRRGRPKKNTEPSPALMSEPLSGRLRVRKGEKM